MPGEMADAVAALCETAESEGLQSPFPQRNLGLMSAVPYEDIAQAIRAQNGLAREYLPREMAQAIRELSWGEKGDAYALLLNFNDRDDIELPSYMDYDDRYGLWFVRSATRPEPGDEYEGFDIVEVYDDIETSSYGGFYDMPWGDLPVRRGIVHARIVDPISPISCSFWFADFRACMTYDIELLDTQNVTSFEGMFFNCSWLVSIDLSFFNMSNARTLVSMFASCYRLNELHVDGWDVRSVEDMNGVFSGCSELTELDLSTWKFGTSIQTASNCFNGCTNLETIYAPHGCDLTYIPISFRMFEIALKLRGGAGTCYETGKSTAEFARIDTPETPGYFTEKELVTAS